MAADNPQSAIRNPQSDGPQSLVRHFGAWQATALNMSNMIGIGPFITIPLLMAALGGPHSMIGWLIAALIVICDGLIWSELGASMPGSGGSYLYLREAFGRQTMGRLMAFLFIWQFILSGPLEIASGYIGFAQYLGYVWPELAASRGLTLLVITGVGLVNIALLYRRITHIGRLTISLWIGTLLTTVMVIVTGALYFQPGLAFDFPRIDTGFSWGMLLGLGAATRVGVYDYLGYYDICYLGDEVRDPGRTIPRSVIISVIAVALIYFAVNLSIIGVVSWREFVPPETTKPVSDFVVSIMMERVYGPRFATIFTFLILWTAFGSVFALLLGYSRIPYAAARDGYFFRVFGRLHAKHQFPHVSLLLIGVVAIICGFFPLGVVIDVLLITRILVQFIGQIFAVWQLRKNAPEMPRPFRIWFYPLPTLLALAGWVFVFATSNPAIIGFGVCALLAGIGSFLLWAAQTRGWPFSGDRISA
ncbi:MAG: APC family permease [Blastocatellia bacterium]